MKYTVLLLLLLISLCSNAFAMPESLNKALNADDIAYIYPMSERTPEDNKAILDAVAWLRQNFNPGAEMISDSEALNMDLSNKTIIAYGTLDGNAFIQKYFGDLPFEIYGTSFKSIKPRSQDSLVIISAWDNPFNKEKAMVIYTGFDPKLIPNINSVFHGPSQYVIAIGNKAIESGYFLEDKGKIKCSLTKVDIHKFFTIEQIHEDINTMIATMERVHPNLYANIDRDEFYRLKDSIFNGIFRVKRRQFIAREFIPLITLLNDGHTSLQIPKDEFLNFTGQGGMVVPFTIKFIGDEVYIKSSASQNIKPGSKLISVNLLTPEKILSTLGPFCSSDIESFRKHLIETNFAKLLWFRYGPGMMYTMKLESPEGKYYETTANGITLQEHNALRSSEYKNWKAYSYSEPADNVGMIKFNSFYDQKAFDDFLQKTFGRIKRGNIKHLIIDLRDNGGGDSQLGDMLINYISGKDYCQSEKVEVKVSPEAIAQRDLKQDIINGMNSDSIYTYDIEPGDQKDNPLRFSGKVYLLIGPATFSSANMLASTLQCFDMATLIGEETGGLTVSYGDKLSFELKNSGLKYSVSFKKFYHSCGREDGHGVKPDMEVIAPASDFVSGKDTVLEYTLKLINKK